jgi:hypothetical protein
MGQAYAGLLGPLACGAILARGLLAGSGFEPTLLAATCGLFGFAALGFVVGQLAEYLVGESVRFQFAEAMKLWEEKNSGKAVSAAK